MVLWSQQGYGNVVTIDRTVMLDVDAQVDLLSITKNGRLVFDPNASRELRSTGNVVVNGVLEMKQDDATRTHRLVFINVDETKYVGGGLDPIASDVGLWVMGGGRLDLAGAKRLGWARFTAALPVGATQLTLDQDLTGWRIGDELAIVPMGFDAFEYDYATVQAISGRTITLSKACQFAHPMSPPLDAAGRRQGGEVLNLTRNVRVEGTVSGKSHAFIRSTAAQTIAYTAFRYLGPQPIPGTYGTMALGRYAVHFHHCMDGSRGSQVTGCVARDLGSHAYVPHMSDGITMLDCISHQSVSPAYWWDAFEVSNDITYDRCVASRVDDHTEFGHGGCGFKHGSGEGLVTRNCVVVSVYGSDAVRVLLGRR